jgi:hypothetical protein
MFLKLIRSSFGSGTSGCDDFAVPSYDNLDGTEVSMGRTIKDFDLTFSLSI